MCKILLIILFASHFFSCVWYYTGNISIQNGKSWLNLGTFQNQSRFERYIEASFFFVSTLTGLGYGDVYPMNRVERIICIMLMIVGKLIFSAILVSIYSFYEAGHNFELNQLKLKQSIAKKLLSKAVITTSISVRVNKHFDYTRNLAKTLKIKEEQINSIVSVKLKEFINSALYENFIVKLPCCSNEIFLKLLISEVKEQIYVPDSIIYYVNDSSKIVLYHNTGKSIEFDIYTKLIFKQLNPGTVIGEYEFFGRIKRLSTIKAVDYSIIYSITYQAFYDLLVHIKYVDKKIYDEIVNNLHKLKSMIRESNNSSHTTAADKEKFKAKGDYKVTCSFCKLDNRHVTSQCNLLVDLVKISHKLKFIDKRPRKAKELVELSHYYKKKFDRREIIEMTGSTFSEIDELSLHQANITSLSHGLPTNEFLSPYKLKRLRNMESLKRLSGKNLDEIQRTDKKNFQTQDENQESQVNHESQFSGGLQESQEMNQIIFHSCDSSDDSKSHASAYREKYKDNAVPYDRLLVDTMNSCDSNSSILQSSKFD